MVFKSLCDFFCNPLDSLLKKAKRQGKHSFLVVWNRGLGDIPLGLYALVHRIRTYIPQAEIAFLTRPDLHEGFALLEGVSAYAIPHWKRGEPVAVKEAMETLGLEYFAIVMEKPDPTRWLKWQLGYLVPRLRWKEEWDELSRSFPLEKGFTYIGVHVQTETHYAYEKNWPLKSWERLFEKLVTEDPRRRILLFGKGNVPSFRQEGVVDLRGKTTLFAMLSIIKNRCSFLVVPDSGVLSMTYYLDVTFPIRVVSLWADPHQGVLRQNVPSPNPLLIHIPLKGPQEDISRIAVEEVLQALFS